MSINKVTPRSKAAANKDARTQRASHYFQIDAGEFAREHGLEVRTFCGRWISLGGYAPSITIAESGIKQRDCKVCIAALMSGKQERRHG